MYKLDNFYIVLIGAFEIYLYIQCFYVFQYLCNFSSIYKLINYIIQKIMQFQVLKFVLFKFSFFQY